MESHNLKRLMNQGLCVTVNSDDPAYFGGYVLANYIAVQKALNLTKAEIVTLARNSINAAFLSETVKLDWLNKINECTVKN
jgi:adenosine deaminase